MSAPPIDVVHDADRRRFLAVVDGLDSVLEYSIAADDALDLHHTFVPPRLRGQGIASRLAAAALEFAAERGRRVIPTCPFVARYIDAHPRYRPLVG